MASNPPLKLLLILRNDEAEKLRKAHTQKSKFEAHTANKLDDGVEFLSRQHADAVILDPFLDGDKNLSALSRIGARFSEIPIVCILSEDNQKIAAEAIKAGAEDCVAREHIENGVFLRTVQVAIERKKREREVRDFADHYGLAVKGSSVGLWDIKFKDKNFQTGPANELWVSDQFMSLLGFERFHKIDGLSGWLDLVHPEDKKLLKDAFKSHLEEKGRFDVQCRLKRKNEDLRWFRIRGQIFEQGEVYRAAGSMTDIQARREADRELLLAKEKYRSVFENSAVAITVTDEEERIVSWNSFAENMLGMTGEDLYMRPVKSLYPKEEWAKMQSMNLRKKGMLHHLDTKMIRKDGVLLDIDISVTVLKTPDGGKTGSIGIIRDISDRKQNEVVLRKLSSVVEQTGDSVLITDVHGNIEYVNPAFERNTGYSRDELLGKNPRMLKSGKHDEKFYKKLWQTILGGKVFRATMTNKKKSNELYYEEQVITPLKDKDGNVTHFVSTARDISLRVYAEEALKRAKEHAVSVSRLKSEFLANMSHEIRTPMNGVLGMTELLLGSNLSAEQREYAETAKKSADMLLSLINDILDLSKVEAGKLTLETLQFDFQAAVEEAADLMAVRAHDKGIELIVRYAPHNPRRVFGDPGRLRQILTNLISNAIKFTDRGYVLVNVDCRKKENGVASFHVSIEDTGIGIAHENLEHVFDKFTQEDTSTARRFGGTGLGLAICSQLVALMKGKIGADSERGKGSVFWFDIDLPMDMAEPEELPRANLKGLRVGVVEDNLINQKVLREQLSSWGMKSDIFSSGKDLMKAMKEAVKRKEPYHLVILDYVLPEFDGEQIARTIKAEPELKDTELVLLTSLAKRGDAKVFADAGFSAYLVKPVRQAHLMDALAIVRASAVEGKPIGMLTRHTLKENHILEMKNKKEGESTPKADGQRGKILLAEDNEINQQVAKRMLEKLGCSVEVVSNGAQAVKRCGEKGYDMVFMDCMMPEMDGYTATQHIRKLEGQGPKIPIIAITANVMADDQQKCLDAGMDDYVKKPIGRDDLDKMLVKWLKKNSNTEAATPDKSEPGTEDDADDATKAINFARLKSLQEFADDNDGKFIRSLFTTYFENLPKKLHNMKQAVTEADPLKLGREAHGLKGSSSNLGADCVAAICKDLETMGKANRISGAAELLKKLDLAIEQVRSQYETKIKKPLLWMDQDEA